jgi:hypothetical protein
MEGFGAKLYFALKFTIFTPLIYFIEKFIWNDWNLLITVILFIFLDAFALLLRSLTDKSFSFNTAFKSFGLKTSSISLVIFGIGVFDQAMIKGQPIEVLEMINYGFYTMILGFMFISFLTNIYHIYPWPPIKKILDKMNNWFEK